MTSSGVLKPTHGRNRKQQPSVPDGAKGAAKISRTILDYVVSTKEGVLTCNAQDDARWQDAESVTSLGVHEAICVPMLGRYGLVGAIYVDTSMSAGDYADRAGKSCFDEEHLKLMLAIAGQAALAIEDTQFYSAMVQSERLAAMGQTIANLSHHVKNILQGVSGGNYLVEDGLKQHDLEIVAKGWGIVQRNQARIANLVMDMLSFGKDREPDLEWNDVRHVTDEVVDLMKSRAEEASVEIRWQRPEQPVESEFDVEAMHRAILNVVTNAIDAVSQQNRGGGAGGMVTIEAANVDESTRIVVWDNGPGIPDEDAEKIFMPFQSTKGARGTGLGLPVTRKSLREHGGDVTVECTADKGTTFTLSWPSKQKSGPTTQPG